MGDIGTVKYEMTLSASISLYVEWKKIHHGFCASSLIVSISETAFNLALKPCDRNCLKLVWSMFIIYCQCYKHGEYKVNKVLANM